MSNLFKSKFLIGVMIVTVMFVGFAVVNTASAASCSSITMTLKYGMRNSQVLCLQQMLNEKGYNVDGTGAGSAGHETTYFGNATKAAVKLFQTAKGLTADGVFGAKSRASLAGSVSSSSTLPTGCTSTSGFSPTTGQACSTGSVTYPAGCTSASGFSPTTGASCATGQTTTTTTTTVTNGPVSAQLSADNPATATFIATQATADLAHFAFTGNGTVTGVTLQRNGVSSNTVFDGVYLYQGNVRVSESASINNAGIIAFNGLNWVVNGMGVLSVKADINSLVTSGTVGVTLTGFTVNSTTITANIAGNVHNLVAGTGIAGTVTIGTNTATGTAVNAGTNQYTFWSAPVTTNTHIMLLQSMALHYIGSAPNDALGNIHLYVDGTSVATSTGPNALGYIVFDFGATPFSINTGSHTFDVRADVIKGSSRTVKLSLENRADLMILDSQANVNVGVSSFSTNSGASVTISTGTVSVTVDPTFQSMTNVTGGATNVVIGVFKMHAYGEDVKVNHLYVKPTLASQSAVGAEGLNNVALYFCTTATNCSQVGSSQNMTDDTTPSTALDFNLGTSMVLPAGVDSWVQVRADLTAYDTADGTTAGQSYTDGTITVALTLSSGATASTSNDNAQGMSSLDSTIDVPGGSTTTSGLTIQTGLVAIAQNVSLGATSINPNTTNAKIGSFIVQNQSTSEGVHVTNLKVGLTVASADSTNYSNLKTSEASGSGAVPINPAYASSATSWNNFPVDFVLAPGTTKTIDIFADVGNSTGTVTTKMFLTAVGASSNSAICSSTTTGGAVNGCNAGASDGVTNPAGGQTATIQAATFNNGGIVVGSSTAPQYVASGTTGITDATVAVFNFKSTNGATTISELKFRVTGTSTVSTIRVGNSTASVVSGIAYLTGLNIVVPSTGLNVPVYMSYAPVGNNQAGTSGTASFVEMTYVRYQVGNTVTSLTGGQATAVGNTAMGTITSLTAAAVGSTASMTMGTDAIAAQFQPGMIIATDNNAAGAATSILEVQSVAAAVVTVQTLYGPGNLDGQVAYFFSVPQNAAYAAAVDNCPTMSDAGLTVAVGGTSKTDCMVVVGSKPTLTIVDSASLLTNGLVKVGSVRIAADAKGDIAVNSLPLTFTSTGYVTVAGTALVVKNAADQSTVLTSDGTLTLGAGLTASDTIVFTGGYTISAGTSVTFDIYATAATVNNGPGANVLSMKLKSAQGEFLWTDVAGNGSSGAETGAAIYNYPTDSSTIND